MPAPDIARLGVDHGNRTGNDMRAVFGVIMRHHRTSDGDRIFQHHMRRDTVAGEIFQRVAALIFQQAFVRQGIKDYRCA